MNCPKCNSPNINGVVCEDCGFLLGDRPPGRMWVPGVGLQPMASEGSQVKPPTLECLACGDISFSAVQGCPGAAVCNGCGLPHFNVPASILALLPVVTVGLDLGQPHVQFIPNNEESNKLQVTDIPPEELVAAVPELLPQVGKMIYGKSIYDQIMAIQLAPKNPPGKKIPKEQKCEKINISLPRGLRGRLKALGGPLSDHIERACEFYLSVMADERR